MVNENEDEILDQRAIRGIKLINQKKFYEAHDALELAWRDEPGPIRNLYRGILQIGVAYYHIQNGNFSGAQKMFMRAQKWLTPFSGFYLGINIGKLKNDALKISNIIENRNFSSSFKFDGSFFPEIETSF